MAKHAELLKRVGSERRKLREGEYCIAAAARILAADDDKPSILMCVEAHVESLAVDPWISEKIADGLRIPLKLAKQDRDLKDGREDEAGNPQAGLSIKTVTDRQVEPVETERQSVAGKCCSMVGAAIALAAAVAGWLVCRTVKIRRVQRPDSTPDPDDGSG